LDAQATGNHYPGTAPSQVPAMDIGMLRRDRADGDMDRLTLPVLRWASQDIAVWLLHELELPRKPPDPMPPAAAGAVADSRSTGEEAPEGTMLTAAPTPRLREAAGPNLGASSSDRRDVSAANAPAGDSAGHQAPALHSVEQSKNGHGTGLSSEDRTSSSISQSNVLERSYHGKGGSSSRPRSRPRQATPGWSMLEPLPDQPRGAAFIPWLTWMQAARVNGRVLCLLGRHSHPVAALGWIFGCMGVGPVDREAAAPKLLERMKNDGSLEGARVLNALPVALASDVLSASATLVFSGEVPVSSHDSLADLRGRLVAAAMHESPLHEAKGNDTTGRHFSPGLATGSRAATPGIIARQREPISKRNVRAESTELAKPPASSVSRDRVPTVGKGAHGMSLLEQGHLVVKAKRETKEALRSLEQSVSTSGSKNITSAGPLRLPPPLAPGFAFLGTSSSRPVPSQLEGVTRAMAAQFAVVVITSSEASRTHLPRRPDTVPFGMSRTLGRSSPMRSEHSEIATRTPHGHDGGSAVPAAG